MGGNHCCGRRVEVMELVLEVPVDHPDVAVTISAHRVIELDPVVLEEDCRQSPVPSGPCSL